MHHTSPYQRRIGALADFPACCLAWRGAVVLFDWPERAIKEGADNMMGKSANEIIRKCVSGG
jgi:hypothetical protein